MSYTSTLRPCFSAHRIYMRMSISAQSAASTPPAPERMLMSASRGSYSPDSMVVTSRASMSARRSASSSSAMSVPSPSSSASSYMMGRSVSRERSDCNFFSWTCTCDNSLVTCCACSGSSHRLGSAAFAASSRARSLKSAGFITFSIEVRVVSSAVSSAEVSGRITT